MSKERPTMRDVARLAGVTQPTVSYVINGTASISDEVKQRVNEAIETLHYAPNYSARTLKSHKSHMLGLLIPDILNEYYARIAGLLERHFSQTDYTLLIHSTNYDAATEERAVRQLLAHNVDGFLLAYQLSSSTATSLLLDAGCKVVAMETADDRSGMVYINADSRLGGRAATRLLLAQGRRRVAYVGQNSDLTALHERYAGYLEALREFGMAQPVPPFYTSGPADKWREGSRIGRAVLKADLDGLVVSSDVIAVGILNAVLRAGVRVPQQLAVVGYDDIPLAELFLPALTTVAQPVEEMCRLAAEKLLLLLSGQPTESVVLTPRLIRRETA